MTKYEVEQKFRVERLDGVSLRLRELGAELAGVEEQADAYFGHPARDFTVTDEAFRLRRIGNTNAVTYKGPKIDATTKTRLEIELPLPDGAPYAAQFAELLEALGFTRVAVVEKQRRKAYLERGGKKVEIALDDVARVGQFVELELSAGADGLDQARQVLAELADELQLTHSERRSYLELLLEGEK